MQQPDLLRLLRRSLTLVTILTILSPPTHAFSLPNDVVILPDPPGPHRVSVHTTQLTDYTRPDPFDPRHRPRRLMISLFVPVPIPDPHSVLPRSQLLPYLDPQTAAFEDLALARFGVPNGTLSRLYLRSYLPSSPTSASQTPALRHPQPQPQHQHQLSARSCGNNETPPHHRTPYPLVLLSPALGTTRLFYSVLAQRLSSAGFHVATIDHPYDADIVSFPDGSAAYSTLNTSSPADLLLALQTRVRDFTFVLDVLSNDTFLSSFLPACKNLGARRGIDVSRVGILGHSLGGTAALTALTTDARLACASDLDGSIFGPLLSSPSPFPSPEATIARPALLIGQPLKATVPDATWDALWPLLFSYKLELVLHRARHYSFSDLPLLVEELGLEGRLGDEVREGYLGWVGGTRGMWVLGRYLGAFLGMVLRGDEEGLLEGERGDFPEVEFIRRKGCREELMRHRSRNSSL